MNNPADTLAALAPCPFCGGATRVHSNRDWHRLTGDHDDTCVFVDTDAVMTVPATDECLIEMVAAWNRRASLKGEAEPADVFAASAAVKKAMDDIRTTPPAPQAVEENAGDIPDIGELTPERIEYLAGAVNAAWCKSDMMVRAKRCQQAAQALRMLAAKLHPTPSPAPQGGGEREQAPPNSLPGWDECSLRVSNSDFIAKRKASGGYGEEPDGMYANELHRFIYEYDDADPYRSSWFMHRLEKLIAFVSTPPAQQPGECGEAKAGAHHVRAATELLSSLKSEQLTYSIDGEHEIAASMTTMIEAVAIAVDMFTAALAPKEKGNGPA